MAGEYEYICKDELASLIYLVRRDSGDEVSRERLGALLYQMIKHYSTTAKAHNETWHRETQEDIYSEIFIKLWKIIEVYPEKPVRNWFAYLTQAIKNELQTQIIRYSRQIRRGKDIQFLIAQANRE